MSTKQISRTSLNQENGSVEKDLNNPQIRMSRMMFHLGTPQNHIVLRGVGITRKVKEQSKKNRKIAKNSRRINRGK